MVLKTNEIATEVIRISRSQREYLEKLVPEGEYGIYRGLQVLIDKVEAP